MVAKNPLITPTSQADGLQEATVTVDENARTPGWKLFNFLVYGVMQYGINIGLSLVMYWDNEYNGNKESLAEQKERIESQSGPKKWGNQILYGYRKGFSWIDEKTQEKIANPLAEKFMKVLPENKSWKPIKGIETPTRNDKQFKGTVAAILRSYFLLAWGGRLLMVPNKLLEDAKPKIVRRLDNMIDGVKSFFGKTVSEEEEQTREAAYKRLDGELKTESWLSLLKARIVGELLVGGAILTTVFFDKERKGILRVADGGVNLSRWVNKNIFPKQKWAFTKHIEPEVFDLPAQDMPKAAKLQDLAQNAAIEGTATGIAASYIFFKLKAKELFGKNKKGKSKSDTQPAAKAADDGVIASTMQEQIEKMEAEENPPRSKASAKEDRPPTEKPGPANRKIQPRGESYRAMRDFEIKQQEQTPAAAEVSA